MEASDQPFLLVGDVRMWNDIPALSEYAGEVFVVVGFDKVCSRAETAHPTHGLEEWGCSVLDKWSVLVCRHPQSGRAEPASEM
jgi:hypothetical protein